MNIEPQGHRIGLFGPGGVGKTTLAATAPGPVAFIDLDDSLPILTSSLGDLEVRRVASLTGWQDIRDALHSDGWDDIRSVLRNPPRSDLVPGLQEFSPNFSSRIQRV